MRSRCRPCRSRARAQSPGPRSSGLRCPGTALRARRRSSSSRRESWDLLSLGSDSGFALFQARKVDRPRQLREGGFVQNSHPKGAVAYDCLRTLIAALEVLRPAFTRPGFNNLVVVFAGWVLTNGPHAVTQTLVATSVAGRRHHEAFHRFFSRGTW